MIGGQEKDSWDTGNEIITISVLYNADTTCPPRASLADIISARLDNGVDR